MFLFFQQRQLSILVMNLSSCPFILHLPPNLSYFAKCNLASYPFSSLLSIYKTGLCRCEYLNLDMLNMMQIVDQTAARNMLWVSL